MERAARKERKGESSPPVVLHTHTEYTFTDCICIFRLKNMCGRKKNEKENFFTSKSD